MRSNFSIQVTVCVALLLPSGDASSAEIRGLSNAETARIGKAATALVEVNGQVGGSAFCVHPSGLFITNHHVIAVDGELRVKVVLDSSLDTQKVLNAEAVRSDELLDLALLRAKSAERLAALPLGSIQDLRELLELVVFGYPFGAKLATQNGQYPAITVNLARVASLRRKRGELHQIQLDGALAEGHSGGPVLDRQGNLVGVVNSGKGAGTGVHFAIPVSHVRRFVSRPDIQFEPPPLNRANVHGPVEFRACAISPLPPAKPMALELTLAARTSKGRKCAMELDGDTYRVTAIPVPPPKDPLVLQAEIEYADGSVKGTVADRSFEVAGKTVKLSDVRSIRFGRKPQVVLNVGAALEGEMSDLAAIPVRIGGQSIRLGLTSAVEVRFDSPINIPSVSCTVVAFQGDEEVGRQDSTMYVDRIALREPTASFSHRTERIAATIDDSTTTAWSLYPNITSQKAVFETVEDVGFPRGTLLTFVLDHQVTQDEGESYPKYIVGKFRLSITTDDRDSFADGLPSGGDVSASWIELTPMSAVSENGTVLTIGSDKTILASGDTPSAETYTVAAVTKVTGITGFRLEVLEDASLPSNGPGRCDEGNFCLTGFSVSATPSSILPTK